MILPLIYIVGGDFMKTYQIIKFQDGDFTLDVSVSPEEETVWLTKDEIAFLFSRDRTVISRHISNIFRENELDKNISCAKNARQVSGQIHQKTFIILTLLFQSVIGLNHKGASRLENGQQVF